MQEQQKFDFMKTKCSRSNFGVSMYDIMSKDVSHLLSVRGKMIEKLVGIFLGGSDV